MDLQPEHEELLRRLAVNDEGAIAALFGRELAADVELDDRAVALVRLAALVAIDSAPATFQWCVGSALASGASEAAISDVLVAIAPVIGSARATRAAPVLAAALGHDVSP